MNNSESELERSEPQGPNQTLTPAEAVSKQETAVALPLWGIGSPRERLLAIGMVIVYAVIVYLLFLMVRLLMSGTQNLPGQIRNLLGEVLLALCAIGATSIAAQIEKKPFSTYGFGDRLAGRRFLWGIFWGFAALTAFLLALRVTHHYYFGTPGIHGEQIVKFGLLYLALFLAVAFFEESLTRGYALFKLWQAIGFLPAVVLLSILFGYGHLSNRGESIFGVIAAGLFGVAIAYSIFRTGSLWWAIGFHFMWDYSESFIYGVPDSGFVAPGHLLNSSVSGAAWITGGSVGPEGSYFILLVLAALAMVIHVTLPGRKTV